MKLTGKIVSGAGRGKLLGYPTINIQMDFESVDLQSGVYAVTVQCLGGEFLGAMNFGEKPTFGDVESSCEVFLFDFSGDLYGENVEVNVLEKIRDIKKFQNADELVKQISLDVEKVESIAVESFGNYNRRS